MVMAIGTMDDSQKWRAPFETTMLRPDRDKKGDMYGLPMMLLTGAEYLASVVDVRGGTLTLFVKCTKDNAIYLGAYHISVQDLMYDKVTKCVYGSATTPLSPDQQLETLPEFLWRPLLIEDTIKTNPDKSSTRAKVCCCIHRD